MRGARAQEDPASTTSPKVGFRPNFPLQPTNPSAPRSAARGKLLRHPIPYCFFRCEIGVGLASLAGPMSSRFRNGFLMLGLVAALVGCSSPPKGAGAGKYAAVEVSGFSRMAVEMAAEQVFTEAGFKLASKAGGTLTFEKPASCAQNIVWGGWQTGLWDRVVAKVTRIGDGENWILSADAYRVMSKGDSVLEEEKKMGFAVQAKYQKILERAKVLLDPMPRSGKK